MGNCTSVSTIPKSKVQLITLKRKNSCVQLSIRTDSFVPYIYVTKFSRWWNMNKAQDKASIRKKLLKKGLMTLLKKYKLHDAIMVYLTIPQYEEPRMRELGFRTTNYEPFRIEMEATIQEVLFHIRI